MLQFCNFVLLQCCIFVFNCSDVEMKIWECISVRIENPCWKCNIEGTEIFTLWAFRFGMAMLTHVLNLCGVFQNMMGMFAKWVACCCRCSAPIWQVKYKSYIFLTMRITCDVLSRTLDENAHCENKTLYGSARWRSTQSKFGAQNHSILVLMMHNILNLLR